eukprot:c18426_g1_i1 orf=79-780(+)
MEGPLSRMWGSSSSSSSGSLRLRWRLPAPSSATAGGNAHHSSAQTEQPKKLRFPVKAAFTAGILALLGDTAAQLRSQWVQRQLALNQPTDLQTETIEKKTVGSYDWFRALRMTTYGFLIYGPSSQFWYNFLDNMFREKTLQNLSIKVALNQIVLGPYVIAVVFAWNSLWQGKLNMLPALYSDRALSTLIDGWKFWIPASVLNFGLVPLQARVAFMSSCAIFWNFYLSTTMGKA